MYNSKKAEKFWRKRHRETDELSAGLSFGSPDYVNKTYSKWKIKLVLGVLHELKNKKIVEEHVELKKSDAVNIHSPDSALDIVLCLGLLEHLPLNILKATKESSDLAIPSKR